MKLLVWIWAAHIAHVCYVNEIPFLAVRAITDCADEEAKDNFEENCKKASEKSAEFVRLLLKSLKNRERGGIRWKKH